MMATFLREASTTPGFGHLAAAADAYERLSQDWSALADALLPEDVPEFARIRKALEERAEATAAGASEAVAREHWAKVDALQAAVKASCGLDAAGAAAMRRSLGAKVRALHAAESEALSKLTRP